MRSPASTAAFDRLTMPLAVLEAGELAIAPGGAEGVGADTPRTPPSAPLPWPAADWRAGRPRRRAERVASGPTAGIAPPLTRLTLPLVCRTGAAFARGQRYLFGEDRRPWRRAQYDMPK